MHLGIDLQFVVSKLSSTLHFHFGWLKNIDETSFLLVMKAHAHHHMTTFSLPIENILSYQNENL